MVDPDRPKLRSGNERDPKERATAPPPRMKIVRRQTNIVSRREGLVALNADDSTIPVALAEATTKMPRTIRKPRRPNQRKRLEED